MNNQENIYLSTEDYFISGENFDLLYEPKLDMLSTFPKPPLDQLSKYYESEEYISHTDNKKGLFSYLYQSIKKRSLQKKVKLILSENGSVGSLLDIGAGTGDFLKVAKDNGWMVEGTEPNENAFHLATAKGVFLKSSILDLGENKYDVVTMWHVFEHVPNLQETIQQLNNLVKPNGTLIIAVPNYKCYDAKYYREFWAAYDVPRHLWHFSKKSITILFQENFTLQKIKPMFFDSFYVSLLSEKYKTGNKFSLKALLIGLRSNIQALFTKEYSSHIYCFKKME